jgi:hypothetical protein
VKGDQKSYRKNINRDGEKIKKKREGKRQKRGEMGEVFYEILRRTEENNVVLTERQKRMTDKRQRYINIQDIKTESETDRLGQKKENTERRERWEKREAKRGD